MKRRLIPYLCTAIGTLLLLWPAIFNGYPILNNDDGTYISSGFIPDTPADRPITYGLLLRIASINGLSLWGMAVFQSLAMSWLVQRSVRRFANISAAAGLGIVAALALFTPLSYCCSLLMPDVFTPAALLCAVLLLAGNLKRGTSVGLYALYAVCIATHLSHVLLFSLLLLALLLLKKWLLPKTLFPGALKRAGLMGALTLLCILTMGAAISKSKHVFIAGGMADRSVLKPYLQAHCPADSFLLCPYADALPEDNDAFIWDTASPLYRTGGWAANKDDLNRIIWGSITEPRFLKLQISTSLRATAQQLIRFETGEGAVTFDNRSSLFERVARYLPGDTVRLLQARQQKGLFLPGLEAMNKIYIAVMGISCLLLVVVVRKRIAPDMRLLLFSVLFGVLLNAWDCATLSGVMGRYGCKMSWMLPFAVMMLFLRKDAKISQGTQRHLF